MSIKPQVLGDSFDRTYGLTPLMTHTAFLRRLNDEEKQRFDALLQGSWQARQAYREFEAALNIDVNDPELQRFVGAFVLTGVITDPARVPELLAPIPLNTRGAINPTNQEVTP